MSERLTEQEREALHVAMRSVVSIYDPNAEQMYATVERILADRLDAAEAEVSYLEADLDNVRERLWRLAALAGWRPGNPSDNEATAELYIADAVRGAQAVRERGLALAAKWERPLAGVRQRANTNEDFAEVAAMEKERQSCARDLRAALGVDSSHSGTTNEEGRDA